MVTEKAFAKINLFLDVTSRREDGYHNIISVMQSVSLCDTLHVSALYADDTQIRLYIDDPKLSTDENNLIYKSVLSYLEHYDIKAEVDIKVFKRIPIGAGLGGGSSDAAATLRALDNIFNLATEEDLLNIAVELGSDVPFCLLGGRALCTGRGERVEKLADLPLSYYVIAIGEGRVSTPRAYADLDRIYNNFVSTDGERKITNYPFYNIFENVVALDDISKIKEIMIKNEAEYTLMSGSGPAVFGKFKDQKSAETAEEILHGAGYSAYLCHSVKGAL